MKRFAAFAAALVALATAGTAHAQISISALESTYTQDFDMLSSMSTSSTMPAGWAFSESGSNMNATYSVGTGSGTTGDTLSLGVASSTERALGSLRSGSLASMYGAQFTNGTTSTIGSVSIDFMGEQWRLGVSPRTSPDRLDFQYSTDATSLTTGTWTDVDALDFASPVTTGAVGALMGNVDPNRTHVVGTVTVSLAPAARLWIRFVDFDATPGADDDLAVDDFHLVAHGVTPPPAVDLQKTVSAPTPAGPTSVLTYTIDASPTGGQGIASGVITDTLPAGVTALGTNFTLDSTVGAPTTLTIAADADAGEIVGGVVTVRVGALPVGDIAEVSFQVSVDSRTTDGTLANSASMTFTGAVSGTGTATSNTTSTSVVRCVTSASGTIPLCQGTIAVDVFFDANENGTRDPGESGLTGWDVALDGGAAMNTGASGLVTFANVASDTAHPLSVVAPTAAGTWSFTAPASATTPFATTTTVSIAVTCSCPDDGNACTPLPVCNAGACGATPPVDCDDHNACTTDSCGPSGCLHAPLGGTTCNDGNASTRNDVCSASGVCGGTAYTCTPGTCEASSVPNGVDCTITYASVTTPCGPAPSGDCDVADHCSGTDGTCVSAVQPSTFVCRPSIGDCDVEERCDGAATSCPADAVAGTTTVCRPSVDVSCDPAESCDGSDVDCPADQTTCGAIDAGVDAAVDVDAGTTDDAGTTEDAGTTTDAGSTPDAGTTSDGGARDGSTSGDGATNRDGGGTTPPVVSSGCGCRVGGGGTNAGMALVSLAVLGLVIARRRRR
ncbi:MAG: MYXO-CTERM sorting domain-containing protein [Sandaracinus sp.]